MYRIKELFMFIIGCILVVIAFIQMIVALFHGELVKAFVYLMSMLFLLYAITLILEVDE